MVNGRSGALRLLLQFLRVQDAHDPYAFRFEPQDYILPSAGGDSPIAHFDWTPKTLADLQAVRLPGRDPAVVQRVGERLRRFIKDAGWGQHEQEIAQAIAERRPIFLTIRSSAAELYALPWELLTLKSGQHIGEVDGLLLRFEWPESKTAAEHPIPRPEGGRILFAWSAAGGVVPVAEHVQAIRAACKAGVHPFNADTDVLSNASLSGLDLCSRAAIAILLGMEAAMPRAKAPPRVKGPYSERGGTRFRIRICELRGASRRRRSASYICSPEPQVVAFVGPELPSGQIGIAKLLQHVNVVAAGEGGGIADLALAHGAA